MKDLNDWNTFVQTGKIEDYLKYISSDSVDERQDKEESYAGFHNDDGNNTKNDTIG